MIAEAIVINTTAWAATPPTERPSAREVLIELFTEEVLRYSDLLADLVIARLGSRGFVILRRDHP